MRRLTRRKFSAEEKIRTVLDGLRAKRASRSFAGGLAANPVACASRRVRLEVLGAMANGASWWAIRKIGFLGRLLAASISPSRFFHATFGGRIKFTT